MRSTNFEQTIFRFFSVHASKFVARCSVAVLERLFPYPRNTSIFIYINIELNFDYRRIYFGTATLQQPQRTISRSIAELTGKQHFHVMEAIRKMEPAWEKVCQCKFALTSRTIIQPNKLTGDRSLICSPKDENRKRKSSREGFFSALSSRLPFLRVWAFEINRLIIDPLGEFSHDSAIKMQAFIAFAARKFGS